MSNRLRWRALDALLVAAALGCAMPTTMENADQNASGDPPGDPRDDCRGGANGTCGASTAPDSSGEVVATPVEGAAAPIDRPDVGLNVSALSTAETTVISRTGLDLAETFALAHFDWFTGKVQPIALTDTNNPGWVGNQIDYACSPDNYATWCQWTLTGFTNVGGDVSGVSVLQAWIIKMMSDGTGFTTFVSGLPCPTGCGAPTWNFWNYSLGTGVDYPTSTRTTNGQIWIMWRQNDSSGVAKMRVGRITSAGGTLDWWQNDCSALNNENVNLIRGAFDSAGILHLAYLNLSEGRIEHETFNPATSTFGCMANNIGPHTFPTGTCAGCAGTATYSTLDSTCLRHSPSPSIAIDTASSPNRLVVAYSTKSSSNAHAELRWYRSTNAGSNWTWTSVTGGRTDVKPMIVWNNPTANRFHTFAGQATSAETRLREIDWKSTDGGQVWTGSYISAVRSTTAPINAANCYWGDFNGVAADGANASSFHIWERSGADWVIRGRALNN